MLLLQFLEELPVPHGLPRAVDRIALVLEGQHQLPLPGGVEVFQLHIVKRVILLGLLLLSGQGMQIDRLPRKIQRDEVLYYMRRNRMHY